MSASPSLRVVAVVALLVCSTVAPFVAVADAASAGVHAASASVGSASFQQNVVEDHRGDVLNLTVEASQTSTLNLGSPGTGFWLQVTVTKGTTKIGLNTYRAGRATYDRSDWLTVHSGNIKGYTLRTAPLEAPLEVAKYPMNVTVDGTEEALGSFVLTERSTNGISAGIAPRSEKLRKIAPQKLDGATVPLADNGTVAHDDWLVLRVDATGLSGVVDKRYLDGDKQGIELTFAQTNAVNRAPNEFTGAQAARLVNGPGEEFYLLVDTGEHDIQPGHRYDVTFEITESSPLVDEREAVSTSFRVLPREVSLKYQGTRYVVENETTIRGTTTLTQGTTINVTARDQDIPPLLETRTATVTADRTFAVTFDFSDLEPGREFELRLRDQGERVPAVVAGGTTTETTTATTTETTTETTTVATTQPTVTTTTNDSTTTETTTTASNATTPGITPVDEGGTERPITAGTAVEGSSSPVPGFDALAGLLAVVAGLLVARRRG